MGSLFAMGGLLKIEARNYLETKLKYDPEFKIISPLVEESKVVEDSVQKARRDLSNKDIAFFEGKNGFLKIFIHFIQSMVYEDHNLINSENFDYFMRFTSEEFGEILEQERAKDEKTIGALERAHYCLLFLFDLLQFSFQFLVLSEKAKLTGAEAPSDFKVLNP